MKALWITDLHLRPVHRENGQRLLSKILEILISRKPDMVICTGDIFHDKDITYTTIIEMFRDFVETVSQICPLYMIPGNHDYGSEYSAHSLKGFKGMHNVHVVERALCITDKVGLIAYSRQEARFHELMAELGPVETLMGHFDLNGFDLGSGWEEKESWSDPEALSRYPRLKSVRSGHYHLAQEKVIKGIHIMYLGTGATHEFGESDQEKSIGLMDLETGSVERIATGLTLHKTIRMTASDEFPVISDEEIKNGVHFRVIIRGTEQEIAMKKKDQPKVYQAKVVPDFITETAKRLDISVDEKKEDVILKFVNFQKKTQEHLFLNSNLDPAKLVAMGAKYMSKAGRK